MKIAFVDLGRHYGGIEIYILSLAKAWKEMGHSCMILARKDSAFHRKLVQSGFEKELCPVGFDWKSIKAAKKRMIEEQIDLIHMNGINSGVFVSLLHLPVKRVATVHGNAVYDRADKNILIQKLFLWLENQTLKKCEKIISVSLAIKDILVKRGIDENKITVIYNGIEEYVYEEPEQATTETFPICFVGRLEKVKGCEYLIKALSQIKDKNFRCDMYGEGSLKEELMQLAKELQIEDKIVFKGFSDSIRRVLNQYKVLVLPSLYEAFPLTLMEAMNARTLVICSDAGGMPEIISHRENGLRFPVGNSGELAKELIWVMEHPDDVHKMKERAYVKFEKEYTQVVMQEKTFRLLERAYHEI